MQTTLREDLRAAILTKLAAHENPLEGFYCDEPTRESILAVLIAGRHLLLEGPPGTGKTTVARIIASLLPLMETPVQLLSRRPLLSRLRGQKKPQEGQGARRAAFHPHPGLAGDDARRPHG
jgi:predicted ATPase with chaperone activity